MAYRNKTYVAFDADTDILYYYLMCAWKANDKLDFNFHNAHELNNLRKDSSEATIKAKLRERLLDTKLMIVLIGESTKELYKFVRWEIEQALSLQIPLAGCNLNGKKTRDDLLTPPIMKDELAVYLSFNMGMVQECIDTWPESWAEKKKAGKSGPFHYTDNSYNLKETK